MFYIRYLSLFVVFSLPLVCCNIARGEAEPVSLHSEKGDCSVCHVASVEKLNGWFVSKSTKQTMKHDYNKTCQQCHTVNPTHAGGFFGTGNGHAVGKIPSINRAKLPLAADGTITCAVTCHTMHGSTDSSVPLHKHLRLSPEALCKSCHDF